MIDVDARVDADRQRVPPVRVWQLTPSSPLARPTRGLGRQSTPLTQTDAPGP
jgi:hypothetical protein